MAIEPEAFKEAMSCFASGVTIVTTQLGRQRFGLTVSAFSSLSLNPPLVLICIASRLYMHQMIEQSRIFAVNILNAHQVELGMRFAGLPTQVKDRFEGLVCETATTGSPILPDCLCWIDCQLWRRYDGGDHSIFIGEVVAANAASDGKPLLYHGRQWQRGEVLDIAL